MDCPDAPSSRGPARRSSAQRSPSAHDPAGSSPLNGKATPPPTFLTSFPSFSPPEPPSTAKKRRAGATPERKTGTGSGSSSNAAAAGSATAAPPGGGASAVNRTVAAAAQLKKTILDSISLRSASSSAAPPASSAAGSHLFDAPDSAAGDPLAGASDEHVLRIVGACGGVVPAVRKYSSDLAESNERVAAERNSKLRLVEENRALRARLDERAREVEEERRRAEVVRRLFERYVSKVGGGEGPRVQVLESPSGPYALEDVSGSILVTLSDDFVFPDASSYASTPLSSSPGNENIDRGKSMDTIRPKKRGRAPKLPQRLVSSIKSEVVEMKAPVDALMLPPALRGAASPGEALVDRLGFYITPDRERRHKEAAMLKSEDASESSSIHSVQRDDDESFSSANELLCDAPTAPPTKLIFRSESSSRVFIEVDKDEATTFSPVNAVHASADMAAPSAAGRLSALLPPDSSKALTSLLLKLNEAYDVQQRKRTAEWTAFYEQTREMAQKRAGGVAGVTALCSAANASPEMRHALNGLIRRGVPVSFRREVWLERSGAGNTRDPELYASLVGRALTDESAAREISVDVERTLANNSFFREGVGKARLRDVLAAFAAHNPDIGYSQGLNIVAANLLLMVPAPEDAFALLEVLVRDVLPAEYWSRDGRVSGAALERDGRVAEAYVAELFPGLERQLARLGAPLGMFTPGWFISGLAAVVQGEALYRLWDLLFGFCDGRFAFCFALALIKLNRRGLAACADGEQALSYLGARMSSAAVSLDTLINETVKLGERVSAADLRRRRAAATK